MNILLHVYGKDCIKGFALHVHCTNALYTDFTLVALLAVNEKDVW